MDDSFNEFVESLFEDLIQRHPTYGTFLGGKYHKYDGLMDAGSLEEIEEDIIIFKKALERLSTFDVIQLSPSYRLDRDLLIQFLELQLFFTEELKTWETGLSITGGPAGTIGGSLFPLFMRDFAPFETRVRSMIGRMRGSLEYLENTKKLWRRPIKLWTKHAIKECQTTPGFFTVIHQAIQSQGLPQDLGNEFQAVAADLTKKIQEYQKFLETEVLPRATDDWAFGREAFEKLLELRKLPYNADEILAKGEQFLKELKSELEKLAKEIDPNSTNWEDVREKIKENHPPNFKETLEEVRKASELAREFIDTKGLATIANGTKMDVIETPEFLRPLLPFAALAGAEVLGEKQESQYFVTPGSDESFLKEHSYPSIYNTSIHEGWPGHHAQISHGNLFGGIIRSLTAGIETVEGWAHYCEQMMLEEGFYDDKKFLDTKHVEFIQKLDALWRAVRIILDVKLHTEQISFEDAIEYLIAETGMAREGAIAEVTRYTMAPGYQLSYLIGKRLILELRDQFKEELGDKFSLRWFHDIILRSGGIPYYYLKQIFAEKVKELA
ncbi:MAG: DUF885 domain-containing protein [Candidatus Hodarchaeota archaeon]